VGPKEIDTATADSEPAIYLIGRPIPALPCTSARGADRIAEGSEENAPGSLHTNLGSLPAKALEDTTDEVTSAVTRGEIFSFIGFNGVGKSTTSNNARPAHLWHRTPLAWVPMSQPRASA